MISDQDPAVWESLAVSSPAASLTRRGRFTAQSSSTALPLLCYPHLTISSLQHVNESHGPPKAPTQTRFDSFFYREGQKRDISFVSRPESAAYAPKHLQVVSVQKMSEGNLVQREETSLQTEHMDEWS